MTLLSDILGGGGGGGTGTTVTTEAELDTALGNTDSEIVIDASFNITGRKTLYNNVTVRGTSNAVLLTGVGVTATESMFDIPAGVTNATIKDLNMTTAQTTIDGISIQDTAIENLVFNCTLNVPALTTNSAIYCDGQKNRISTNHNDCNGSASSPGCILLDVNSVNNIIANNITE